MPATRFVKFCLAGVTSVKWRASLAGSHDLHPPRRRVSLRVGGFHELCQRQLGRREPRVLDALRRAAEGIAPAYGQDETTRALARRLSTLFEREVAVFLTPTGTATIKPLVQIPNCHVAFRVDIVPGVGRAGK